MNLLRRTPEELSQSGCHKRCPRGVPEASEGGVEPTGGGGGGRGGPPLHMKFSRDAAIPRIPAPHLLKQGQLQLAGASFRDLQRLRRPIHTDRHHHKRPCQNRYTSLKNGDVETWYVIAVGSRCHLGCVTQVAGS